MGDRKYRHRGYMDDDREYEERRPRRPVDDGGRPRSEGAPRGRGLGAPTAVAFKCALCGQQAQGTVELDTTCDRCGKPLHTCTNCAFFDPAARFECRKTISARIEDKGGANQCPLYQPKQVRDLRSAKPESAMDARAAFDALFKK